MGSLSYERVNSFAVLEKVDDLEDPAFGKDERHFGDKTFFDRAWLAGGRTSPLTVTFPCLAVFEYEFAVSKIRAGRSGGNYQSMTHMLEVYLLASMPNRMTQGTPYDPDTMYTFEQMSDFMKRSAASLLHQLSRYQKLVSPESDSGSLPSGWYSQDQIDAQNIRGRESIPLSPALPGSVSNMSVLPYMLSRNLMGCRFTLEVQTNPCAIEFYQ